MENKNQVGSSSSFTTVLFGAKESQPSSAGIFASLFPPPSTVLGKNSSCSEFTGSLQKASLGDNVANSFATAINGVKNIERSSIFQERIEPCPLSSSLYYGGQEDMYIQSSSDQTSRLYPKYKKDEGQYDPDGNHLHSASRGNWWQGSLYY